MRREARECRRRRRYYERSNPRHPANASAKPVTLEFTAETRSQAANIHATELRRERTRGVGAPNLRRLPPLLLFYPLYEQRLKFLLRIDALVNQQCIHRIHSSLEAFIARGYHQCFFKRHTRIHLGIVRHYLTPSTHSIHKILPYCRAPSQFRPNFSASLFGLEIPGARKLIASVMDAG